MTKITFDVNKNNVSAFRVKNDGKLTLKDIDYECGTKIAYGVWASENSEINFESGSIKTKDCACISTNGNDEPGVNINVKDGKLENTNSYAIYMPAYGNINISGGEVQGINMRRGNLTITGGTIKSCNQTKETADDIGEYTTYSGLIWLGDTVAVLSGSNGYIKANNEELNINITGGIVEESFSDHSEPAISVYCLDTANFNQIIRINVPNAEMVKVWTHEMIAEAATAKGKSYTPKSFSTVYINGEKVYGPEEE